MPHILILYKHILTVLFDQHQWLLLSTDNNLSMGSFF
jgi:hypothetical protein